MVENRYHLQNKRHVGLIWFVGKGRTRQRQVSIKRLRFYLVVGALVFLWVPLSVIFISHLKQKNMAFQAVGELLRAQIFEFQVLYTGVYEKVYPRVREEKIEDSSAMHLAKESTKNSEGKQSPPLEVGAELLAIRNVKVFPFKDHIEVAFELHNQSSGSAQKGFLWAAAVFHSPALQNSMISYPPKLKVDYETLLPVEFSKSHRYSVRNFATYSFKAQIQQGSQLLVLKLGAVDEQGKILAQTSVTPNNSSFTGTH